MRLVVYVSVLVGCVSSNAVLCEDGRVCPSNLACDDTHALCVAPDQLTVCETLAQFDACVATSVAAGACYEGVCLPGGCGNGFHDPTEICDDGNVLAGDGCSANCMSDETCGNGVLDLDFGEQCDDGDALYNGDGCSTSCATETPVWTRWSFGNPPDRWRAAAAYDSLRKRIVMFGGIVEGEGNGTEVNDTYEWDGNSWREIRPPLSPSPREGSVMAYDAERKRIVLFGGDANGSLQNDTWEWDGFTRTQRVTPLGAPPARRASAMAYDAPRKRIILFGGFTGTRRGDTWAWDGTAWTQLAPATSPPAVSGHRMAYDPVSQSIVMFGGELLGNAALDTTWVFDGTTWVDRSIGTRPAPRHMVGLAFDEVRQKVVLFGGVNESGTDVYYSNAYTWSGSGWSVLTLATPPDPRAGHEMTTGPDGRVVVFGGADGAEDSDGNDRFFGETYVLDGAAWTELMPPSPPVVWKHAMAYDQQRGQLVAFGGQLTSGFEGRTFVWSGSSWRDAAPVATPSPRHSHAMAYETARGQTLLFGGVDQATPELADSWTWNGTNWTAQSPANSPTARVEHAMVYDAARDRVVLFGGRSGTTRYADTWEWDGATWTDRGVTGPSARAQHAMTYDDHRGVVLLYGGRTADTTELGDIWEWNGTTWTERTPAFSPGPRADATLTYDPLRRTVILFGGSELELDGVTLLQTNFNETWEWNGTAWALMTTATAPESRRSHTAAYVGREAGVFIYGGVFGATELNDNWLLTYGATARDYCELDVDVDADGLAGCADPDCWGACTPTCPPRSTGC